MTENLSDPTPSVIPFLRYQEAKVAIEWLAAAFGFRRETVYEGPDGSIAHAVMSIGSGRIMLGSAKNDKLGIKTPRELGAVSQGVYVYIADVDAHYQQAKQQGAEIVLPISDTDYGSREYTARDLEGNLWSFGNYLPAT